LTVLAFGLRRLPCEPLAETAKRLILVGCVVAALAGWRFVRNQILYGDPLGFVPFRDSVAGLGSVNLEDVPAIALTQFRSFWGVFGWMTVPAPGWFFVMAFAWSVASLAVVGMLFAERYRRRLEPSQRRALLLLGSAVFLQDGFQWFGIASFGQSWGQGRYLFAVFPAAATVVGVAATTVLPERAQRAAAVVLSATLVPSTLFLLLAVIRPLLA
jgi:hypothetical protein